MGSTTVLPAYRGPFGLWIKAAMVRWLADAEPALSGYLTGTAADKYAADHRLFVAGGDQLATKTR